MASELVWPLALGRQRSASQLLFTLCPPQFIRGRSQEGGSDLSQTVLDDEHKELPKGVFTDKLFIMMCIPVTVTMHTFYWAHERFKRQCVCRGACYEIIEVTQRLQFSDLKGFHHSHYYTTMLLYSNIKNVCCCSQDTSLGNTSVFLLIFRSNESHGQASEATETMLIIHSMCELQSDICLSSSR